MECLAVLIVLVLLTLVPLARMLFGKGPNSLRRLTRPDLAAFFVLTAGAAIAFGIARVEQKFSALVVRISDSDPALAKTLRTAWQLPARSLAFRNADHQKEK